MLLEHFHLLEDELVSELILRFLKLHEAQIVRIQIWCCSIVVHYNKV